MMNMYLSRVRLFIVLLIISILSGCAQVTATSQSLTPIPSRTSIPPTNILTATQPSPSTTAAPFATPEPDFPEGCVNLTETPLHPNELNGLFVVVDDFPNFNSYFLDPSLDRLLDIETQTQLSWDDLESNMNTAMLSPNQKFILAYLWDKNYAIISTVEKVIKTYDTQGQEDWNRPRWLDNEHLVFQLWFDAPYGSYTIVIYNPFTGDQKNMQIDLPNPYIEVDTGGRVSWVKANIDSSLKHVLYNDKDERLVLWDLDTQKEIAFLPSPIDVIDGSWSPDGKEFAIPSPSTVGAPQEMFIINMEGTVKMTSFNQKYPFADISARPSWSPDGRYLAFWLQVSNIASADYKTLRQWLAVTDTTTIETQIYCLSSGKPPTGGGGIVWSPDSTQVIFNTDTLSEEVKPMLVDLENLTQTELDTHGLSVTDWMAP